MHFFMLDPDNHGELTLRFPWLPHWMVHNPVLIKEIHTRAKAALPDVTVSDLADSHYKILDEVLIATCLEQCPYVTNLEALLRALLTVELDPDKAPKHQWVGGRKLVYAPA